MSNIVIMRRATLMEDEGQDSFVKTCATRKEADDWVQAQKGEYFGPGDYYVMQPDWTSPEYIDAYAKATELEVQIATMAKGLDSSDWPRVKIVQLLAGVLVAYRGKQ